MELIKREAVRFSDMERRALDMTIILMNNLYKVADDPNLVKLADDVSIKLNELICDYGEEE
jgi:hypothetical protein